MNGTVPVEETRVEDLAHLDFEVRCETTDQEPHAADLYTVCRFCNVHVPLCTPHYVAGREGFTQRYFLAVLLGRMCAAVGVPGVEHGALTLQHRANRGMGGDDTLDVVENLMCLCWGCNVRLEQDASWASLGRTWGWKLTTGEDPAAVAVWFAWAHEWRLLLPGGDTLRVHARDGRTTSLDPFEAWRAVHV